MCRYLDFLKVGPRPTSDLALDRPGPTFGHTMALKNWRWSLRVGGEGYARLNSAISEKGASRSETKFLGDLLICMGKIFFLEILTIHTIPNNIRKKCNFIFLC